MPQINIAKAFAEYDRMKNSVAVFRFFNQKIKVKIEEENGKVRFVMPWDQIEQTTFTKKQKRNIASILLPWYSEDLDKGIFDFLDDDTASSNKLLKKKNLIKTLIAEQKKNPQDEVEISILELLDLNNNELPKDIDVLTLLTSLFSEFSKFSAQRDLAELQSSALHMGQINNSQNEEQSGENNIKNVLDVTTQNEHLTKSLEEAYEKLNDAFQTQMLGANLDDDDNNSSNALWLPVLRELINCTIAFGAFGEAVYDKNKTSKLISNYNYWLEHELVNLYSLESELSKLNSTYKMIEFKNYRDNRVKDNKHQATDKNHKLLENISPDNLNAHEAILFKGIDLYTIYELPISEYRKQLKSAAKEYVTDERPESHTQDQLVQLIVMLERNHVQRLIAKKQENIVARNSLAIYHINRDRKLSDSKKADKRDDIKKIIDKYTNRNNPSLMCANKSFYNQLCEPLQDRAWTLRNAEAIQLEMIKEGAMKPLRIEH